jgi:rare lipoprotein A
MTLAQRAVLCSSLIGLLAGCSSLSLRTPDTRVGTIASTPAKGGYYKDDGPGDNPPADLAAIPDAQPRVEPLHRYANRPYSALGRSFTPQPGLKEYRQRGLASWYGRRFHGKPTASGEIYDMYAMTAAHPTLPIPSFVRVSNPKNGSRVIVRVNDRGPFHKGRLIDLSYAAAWKLDLLRGVSEVDIELIDPESHVEARLTESGPPGGIYLQLAALTTRSGIDELTRRVQDAALGLPGLHRVDSAGWLKLQVGPYAETAQAEAAAEAIERALGIKPLRVVR